MTDLEDIYKFITETFSLKLKTRTLVDAEQFAARARNQKLISKLDKALQNQTFSINGGINFPCKPGHQGLTLLQVAILQPNPDTIKSLLERGASPLTIAHTKDSLSDNKTAFDMVLEYACLDKEGKNISEEIALFFWTYIKKNRLYKDLVWPKLKNYRKLAKKQNYIELEKVLTEELKQKDEYFATLTATIQSGNLEAIRIALNDRSKSFGVGIIVTWPILKMCIDCKCEPKKKLEILQLLLDPKYGKMKSNGEPLIEAIEANDIAAYKLLREEWFQELIRQNEIFGILNPLANIMDEIQNSDHADLLPIILADELRQMLYHHDSFSAATENILEQTRTLGTVLGHYLETILKGKRPDSSELKLVFSLIRSFTADSKAESNDAKGNQERKALQDINETQDKKSIQDISNNSQVRLFWNSKQDCVAKLFSYQKILKQCEKHENFLLSRSNDVENGIDLN